MSDVFCTAPNCNCMQQSASFCAMNLPMPPELTQDEIALLQQLAEKDRSLYAERKCPALDYMHSLGMVHYDFVSEDGTESWGWVLVAPGGWDMLAARNHHSNSQAKYLKRIDRALEKTR